MRTPDVCQEQEDNAEQCENVILLTGVCPLTSQAYLMAHQVQVHWAYFTNYEYYAISSIALCSYFDDHPHRTAPTHTPPWVSIACSVFSYLESWTFSLRLGWPSRNNTLMCCKQNTSSSVLGQQGLVPHLQPVQIPFQLQWLLSLYPLQYHQPLRPKVRPDFGMPSLKDSTSFMSEIISFKVYPLLLGPNPQLRGSLHQGVPSMQYVPLQEDLFRRYLAYFFTEESCESHRQV